MKNRELIAGNLQEAIGQLEDIVQELTHNPTYSEMAFRVALEHAYHHINFAWHIRKVPKAAAVACADENFNQWSKFPVGEIREYDV